MRTLLALALPLASMALASEAWASPDGAAAPAAVELPAAPPPASAGAVCCPDASADPCCVPGVRWNVTLGLWVWGIDGTIGDNGRSADVDADWTDTLELLDKVEFALDARVRAEWGKWRLNVGVDGSTLADSAEFVEAGVSLDAEVSFWTAYASLGYVVAGGRMGCDACAPTWCLDAYAGLRYYATGIEMANTATAAPNTVDSSNDWVDPFVGLHLAIESRSWIFVAEADVGGFGVGSDFAWSALAAVGYRFSRGFSTLLGWKVLDVDREDGTYIFDVQLSGPFLAFTFSF